MDSNLPIIELKPYTDTNIKYEYDLNSVIFDLDSQIKALSSKADKADYLISASSGILCGILDILWVGEFSLVRGRDFASKKVDDFVIKTAKTLGCDKNDISSCVKFLEKKFPLASDGNTPDFGGGLQHHLRDFAHHPTIVGLFFSLLTQFTYKSYGTDVNGIFKIVDVTAASRAFIGDDVPKKILFGTVIWFFHLVSDIAGSGATAGLGGGTGIPGPLLSLAKEISALPFFKNLKIKGENLSVFLSKLFNGTLLAKRDSNGKIIKDTVLQFDFRTELGLGLEIGRQAVPVIANECIVRAFYFIRRLASEMKNCNISKLADFRKLEWDKIKPFNNPTIARMLTISTGVFTTIDIGGAALSQNFLLSINYIGIGRFAIAIGQDVAWGLQSRNLKKIKKMYQNIKRYVYTADDNCVYERIENKVDEEKFGLSIDQTEILYNLEYYKVLNNIEKTKNEETKALKEKWLAEWVSYMTEGFSAFLQNNDAVLHWFTKEELIEKVESNEPEKRWFRLVLLEAMLFKPYFPLSLEKDDKGNDIPSRKYRTIQGGKGYSKTSGDNFLDSFFTRDYYQKGYIKRLRRCYREVLNDLNEFVKNTVTTIAVGAGVAVLAFATAGAFAPHIAVLLVGSKFAGLSGIALTNASLAFLGGGAIAAGGAGMAGGTAVIVGGSAVLGFGVGSSVRAVAVQGKKYTVLESAKLICTVREIILNDEKDIEYAKIVVEDFADANIVIEKDLVDIKAKKDKTEDKEERKRLKADIHSAEETLDVRKRAVKRLRKYISSFEVGLSSI